MFIPYNSAPLFPSPACFLLLSVLFPPASLIVELLNDDDNHTKKDQLNIQTLILQTVPI